MKKSITIFLLLLFLGGSYWFYLEKVDNFSCSDLYLSTWPKTQYRNLPCHATLDEVREILNQPFTYLAKGRQFYVFASKDGKYVLKFLKCQRVNVSSLYKTIPLPECLDKSRRARLEQKEAKITSLFQSCALSATQLYHGTGVLFVHLTDQPELQQEITITDGAGFSHLFEIDKVPFVLQLRAQSLFSTLDALIQKQDNVALDQRLQQLVDLVQYDADHSVIDCDEGYVEKDNLAFLPDRAIHADIGAFYAKREGLKKHDLVHLFSRYQPITDWLAKKDPKLADSFQRKINRALEKEDA